ncbi:hypothetical protein HNP12_003726 [Aeromonas hydrophila]|uniref:hypothetical protein n=1 Tax=Aeromonas hydrophila TaxID=644 RepID=UPI0021696AA4|nr:hypothetical protein [Aeromonas hydrophila]MCS3769605.1 hypothetical protein [Aeromonas hydrophila]
MNNRVDTTLPRSARLGLSAHTEARFQSWMQQALANLGVSPKVLSEGHTALVTLASHECVDSAAPTSPGSSANPAGIFPNTTCTLHWQSGCWVIASLSSLTHIEETAPPCCEHAFWFGQETVGYQLQWAPMCHEALVIALQAWEQQLSSMPALVIEVSLVLDNEEHDITLCARP